MTGAQEHGLYGAALQSDDGLNPPQKVLRRRLGPAGRAAEERKLAEQELRELRDAKKAADAARAEAEAERLRLDARLQEQEAAMWAAKLAEQKAMQRAEELEADLKGYAATASEVRSQVAELDEQLAAARAASEAASRRQAAALRAQLEKLEKELRDNALHTGRPSTQARWAIGVVQSLVPQQDQHQLQKKQVSPAFAHQPVALANPVKSPPVARADIDQRSAVREQSQHIPAGGPPQIAKVLNPAQQQAVQHKYSGPGGEEKAATFLQSVVRGGRVRRKAEHRERCVRMLQAAMRGWNGRRAAAQKRLSMVARSKAEQELFERMQELAQRSGLRHDWRKHRDSARQPKATTQPRPEQEPQPELGTQDTQEETWHSGRAAVENDIPVVGGLEVHDKRRRRYHRPRTPEPALATTFAGLHPRARWRPAVATSQTVPAVRSSQRGHRRPATTDGAKWLGRDENFPDVRYPGGQPRRSTAESEVERAKREWQRLQDTASTFGFAGAIHARRKETQQRRNVQRWDGRALPCKGAHVSAVSVHGFSPVKSQAVDTQQHSFTEDEFSDPSAVLDDKLAAESEAAMAALGQARANYEKAVTGLPPKNPHTYVVEYPDGSLDMFGGGGVAVGPDEGVVDAATALKTVEEIVAELDYVLTADNTSVPDRSQASPVRGSPVSSSTISKDRNRQSREYKWRMWSRDQHGSWNALIGNLGHAGGDSRQTTSQRTFSDGLMMSRQHGSQASAELSRNRIRKSTNDHQHKDPTISAFSRRPAKDAIEVIMV